VSKYKYLVPESQKESDSINIENFMDTASRRLEILMHMLRREFRTTGHLLSNTSFVHFCCWRFSLLTSRPRPWFLEGSRNARCEGDLHQTAHHFSESVRNIVMKRERLAVYCLISASSILLLEVFVPNFASSSLVSRGKPEC
jgi:hypothetical protein